MSLSLSLRHCTNYSQERGTSSVPSGRFADPPKRVPQDLSPVQMTELFPAHSSTNGTMDAETDVDHEAAMKRHKAKTEEGLGEDGLPQLRNVYSVEGNGTSSIEAPSYRVTWFDFDVHPSKRYLYWAFRRLRDLPPDWRRHYRIYLRQETKAQLYLTNTWDMFMSVVDGYRKAKWVLRKYDIPIDNTLIPHPYNDFWEVTTPEERAWAHRRATLMKESQAIQRAMEDDEEGEVYRDDDDEGIDEETYSKSRKESEASRPIFGGGPEDFRTAHMVAEEGRSSKTQSGNALHSRDMKAPSEREISDNPSGYDRDYNSFIMGTVEDDKLWNPVLKNRLYQQKTKQESDLYAFEDDDEFAAPSKS